MIVVSTTCTLMWIFPSDSIAAGPILAVVLAGLNGAAFSKFQLISLLPPVAPSMVITAALTSADGLASLPVALLGLTGRTRVMVYEPAGKTPKSTSPLLSVVARAAAPPPGFLPSLTSMPLSGAPAIAAGTKTRQIVIKARTERMDAETVFRRDMRFSPYAVE